MLRESESLQIKMRTTKVRMGTPTFIKLPISINPPGIYKSYKFEYSPFIPAMSAYFSRSEFEYNDKLQESNDT